MKQSLVLFLFVISGLAAIAQTPNKVQQPPPKWDIYLGYGLTRVGSSNLTPTFNSMGGVVQFQTTFSVTWSLLSGSYGTISSTGLYHATTGYFQAQVQPEPQLDETHMLANVVFHINLGKRAKVGNVEVRGPDPAEANRLLHSTRSLRATASGASLKTGKPYTLIATCNV